MSRKRLSAALKSMRPAGRLEICWNEADKAQLLKGALQHSPKEGAMISLCRFSTGTMRKTFIVADIIEPQLGDLRHRGRMVSITSSYLNRAIDSLLVNDQNAGITLLHSHPGAGIPEWSPDDDVADADAAKYFYGEGFIRAGRPLISIVISNDNIRARQLSFDSRTRLSTACGIDRIRTIGRSSIQLQYTIDGQKRYKLPNVPPSAERAIRVFGKDGQRMLADLHVAIVGTGGVGSMVADHVSRWGVGKLSVWDPDLVKDVNINRSGIFSFADAKARTSKVQVVAQSIKRCALCRHIDIRPSDRDVRLRAELPYLLNADVILMLVDDVRVRHFVNRVSFAHYIPVFDGANAIRSTGENDGNCDAAVIEDGGIRVSHLYTSGPCLWCCGHVNSKKLSLAYRTPEEIVADRARGYVEDLGPEHAPSVMPVNTFTAGMLEIRLQDYLYGLTRNAIPEIYFSLLGHTLDVLPRKRSTSCSQCVVWEGKGDCAEITCSDD